MWTAGSPAVTSESALPDPSAKIFVGLRSHYLTFRVGDIAGPYITDAALWSPSTATWNLLTFPPRSVYWGHINDTPAPADYDGDRTTDFGLFHDGYWYIQSNLGGTQSVIQFGGPGDIPVPQDFDGGKADLTVFRPWTSEWYILKTTDNTIQREVFGGTGDFPVPSK